MAAGGLFGRDIKGIQTSFNGDTDDHDHNDDDNDNHYSDTDDKDNRLYAI